MGQASSDYEHRIGRGGGPSRRELPSLEAIERRRRRLWLITGFFLLAASGSVAVTLADVAVADAVPNVPALRWGLLALATAFLLYVFDQERLLRGFTRAFVAHDVHTATLESRVADLTTLTRLGRTVNSVLTISEVVETVLDVVFELSGARNGSVMLREDEELRVVASRGPEAAPEDATVPVGQGMAGEVALRLRPLLVTGQLPPADRAAGRREARAFGSAAVVPLVAHGEVVGVLSLERAHGVEALTELDLRSIALFAEHAGVAISNAQRYEEEQSTAARLAEVLELRSEFVAALVHDLKNPITAMLGYASLIRGRWASLDVADRDRGFEAIAEEGERLLAMIDELLKSTSVDAGAELRRTPLVVATLLQPLVATVATATRAREGVERAVRLSVDDAEPTIIQGDPQALRHVFTNLLDNAVKYSPPGSPVEVVLSGGEHHVVVVVTDHGEGIDVDDLPFVFERFRQAPGRSGAGVGLGLYIARTLVTAHGGSITVTSTPGKGSAFRVVLPSSDTEAGPDDSRGAAAAQ